MGIRITTENNKNFGSCVFMRNGGISLGVTLEVGPRIIYFSRDKSENLFFEDIDRHFSEPAGEYGTWYAYGGHRLWCAPEVNPETYYPDNSRVSCVQSGNTVILSPPITPFGKKYELIVTMDEEKPVVTIEHRITNLSDKSSVFAPWSVTSLKAGGICFIPLSERISGYLPNRVMSLWDYSDINDERFTLANGSARLSQDSNAKRAFKAGFNVEDGYAAYFADGCVFAKCFGEYGNVTYPDYSCNFEVYTNRLFLECELLGEKRAYASGETAVLKEKWLLEESAYTEQDIINAPESVKKLLGDRIKNITGSI